MSAYVDDNEAVQVAVFKPTRLERVIYLFFREFMPLAITLLVIAGLGYLIIYPDTVLNGYYEDNLTDTTTSYYQFIGLVLIFGLGMWFYRLVMIQSIGRLQKQANQAIERAKWIAEHEVRDKSVDLDRQFASRKRELKSEADNLEAKLKDVLALIDSSEIISIEKLREQLANHLTDTPLPGCYIDRDQRDKLQQYKRQYHILERDIEKLRYTYNRDVYESSLDTDLANWIKQIWQSKTSGGNKDQLLRWLRHEMVKYARARYGTESLTWKNIEFLGATVDVDVDQAEAE
jgi:5S rRNA maturation endonuclease (ribonuclease M5)